MVLDRQHKVAAVFRVALLAEDIRPLLDRLTIERGHLAGELPCGAYRLGSFGASVRAEIRSL